MKTITLLVCLIATRAATGQVADPVTAKPAATTTGAFFAVMVADLEASTRWYREKLGLGVVMEVPKGDQPAAVTVLEGGGLIVELIQHDSAQSLKDLAPGRSAGAMVQGLFKVGIVVDDFDATLATFRARRVEIVAGPFPARQGQRANVLIKDNAGNLIQIIAR